jgi:hypothetical protein
MAGVESRQNGRIAFQVIVSFAIEAGIRYPILLLITQSKTPYHNPVFPKEPIYQILSLSNSLVGRVLVDLMQRTLQHPVLLPATFISDRL